MRRSIFILATLATCLGACNSGGGLQPRDTDQDTGTVAPDLVGNNGVVDAGSDQREDLEPPAVTAAIVAAVEHVIDMDGSDCSVRGVTLMELRTGMILKEEVRAANGLLLVAGGQEVTVSLLGRIQNYNDTVGLQLPMWVEVPQGGGPDQPQAPAAPDAAEHEFNFS